MTPTGPAPGIPSHREFMTTGAWHLKYASGSNLPRALSPPRKIGSSPFFLRPRRSRAER